MANAQKSKAAKRPAPEKPQDKTEREALKGDQAETQQKNWDLIDEHAWESFPASDAPASWAGRDLTPEERERVKARNGAEPRG